MPEFLIKTTIIGTGLAIIVLLVALFNGRQAGWSLVLKYLRKRRIAWVSLIAVMLCTTMVLVVISIMGGWLRMFKESFHGLGGDLIVQSHSLTGYIGGRFSLCLHQPLVSLLQILDGSTASFQETF